MVKLGTCLEAFGWQDCSCATLAGVSGRQLREMLRSIACMCMVMDCMEDLESKSKLCVLNAAYVNGLMGGAERCRRRAIGEC